MVLLRMLLILNQFRMLIGAFFILSISACVDNNEHPSVVKQCAELIPVIDDFLLKNNKLPLPRELDKKYSDLAEKCDYQRDFDSWSMSLHGQTDPKTCSALFEKLADYHEKFKSLPDNLADVDPSIPLLSSSCNLVRGGEKTYSMQIYEGSLCTADLTGGCSASDCRSSWQKILDSNGILRPPLGRSEWSYSSRLGNDWMKSCGNL